MNNFSSISQLKQGGFVLFMSLVLLFMLTLLALTEVSLNTTQTRVATNASDGEVSFEKTEGAINEALSLLINYTYTADKFLNNGNGFYLLDQNAAPLWTTIDWSSSSAVINSFQGSSGSAASYLIEQLPSVVAIGQNFKSPTHVYRITARSVEASGNSSVVIQTTLQIQQ